MNLRNTGEYEPGYSWSEYIYSKDLPDEQNKIWMELYATSRAHSTSSGIPIFYKRDIKGS